MIDDKNIPAIPVHPGEILLKEFLEPMDLTQTALAHHLDVPVRRINEICRARRAVTAETAWLLAQAFGTSPQFWLNLQALYELAVAKNEGRVHEIEAIST
ncbi:MAG: HigA family addiction module antidote protein [Pirellulales bacterium]|nr:HigA family addiction module antidote protein [Pirellulales bacterium]